jgi:hypothetical protein
MTLPGFSAETSLQRTVLAYNMAWGFDQMGNVIWPQVCDQTCLDNCEANCPDPGDCSDLPPQLQARCRAAAAACLRACVRKCCPICTVTCGQCTGGSCNPYPNCGPVPLSGTQTCTDCHGVQSTRSC